MHRPLVVYYSYSGTTRRLAEQIAAQVSGALVQIVPETPYSFDYNTAAKEVRAQIARGFCPRLAAGGEPIHEYNPIFIGTPNWFHSIAPPVLAFLRRHDLSKRCVVPFCTHGGGGFGEIQQRMAEECPGANLLPGLCATAQTTPAQIAAWLSEIGIEKSTT